MYAKCKFKQHFVICFKCIGNRISFVLVLSKHMYSDRAQAVRVALTWASTLRSPDSKDIHGVDSP